MFRLPISRISRQRRPSQCLGNIAAATAMFKARGAAVGETNLSGTKAILSNIVEPNGIRMELAELPPELLHRQAVQRWR